MIFDKLENSESYFSPESPLAKAFEFIRTFEITKPDGRYEIDGAKIYANIDTYLTKSADKQIPESHRKYVDVQVLLKGKERIDTAIVSNNSASNSTYDDSRDLVFYKELKDSVELYLSPGYFAVFYPQDIHKPGCNSGQHDSEVRKIVVKIAISELQK